MDQDFLKICTRQKIKDEYNLYVVAKTDTLVDPIEISVQVGADGITHEIFTNTLQHQIDFIHKRIHRGNFFFYPFREVVISKDPNIKNPYEAWKLDKYRILSIASIRDVIVQKLLYDFLYPIAEKKFQEFKTVSFAYRKNLNAPKAAQKIYNDIKDGYYHALDADLKGFFDTIPHSRLIEQINFFFGESAIVSRLLYRFVHADRVEWQNVRVEPKKRSLKVKRTRRKLGIPQGGILSGLLANIYLHQFDEWVVNSLGKKYSLRYTRYADDFVILTKEASVLPKIKEECRLFLQSLELTLHTDSTKTKILDLTTKNSFVNFVGFSLSQKHIRIKEENVEKFKSRVKEVLIKTNLCDSNSFKMLKLRLDYKYIGNEMKVRKCQTCGNLEGSRNWLKFFLTLTDVEQLKSIDRWVYYSIHRAYYLNTNQRLNKKVLSKLNLLSLEKLYYQYKKLTRKKQEICRCSSVEKKLVDTRNPLKELFRYY